MIHPNLVFILSIQPALRGKCDTARSREAGKLFKLHIQLHTDGAGSPRGVLYIGSDPRRGERLERIAGTTPQKQVAKQLDSIWQNMGVSAQVNL